MSAASTPPGRPNGLPTYGVLGALFGVVLTKAEVISWFRIQEMFRFQAFHMYGVIGTAVVTAALALQLIKRRGLSSLAGERVVVPPKALGRGTRYWLGGTMFGLGWALVGACPGPLFALLGNGVSVIVVPLLSAVAGTWLYGAVRGSRTDATAEGATFPGARVVARAARGRQYGAAPASTQCVRLGRSRLFPTDGGHHAV